MISYSDCITYLPSSSYAYRVWYLYVSRLAGSLTVGKRKEAESISIHVLPVSPRTQDEFGAFAPSSLLLLLSSLLILFTRLLNRMTTPSLCGSFLSSKQSLVAFIWTATTLLTLMAFVMAIIMTVQINMQYQHLASMYAMDDDAYNQGGDGEGEEHGSQDENNDSLLYSLMATTSSRSMTFVAVYTMALAVVLNLYGSTAIVGFTSLRGDYIAPCFSSEHSSMKVGIFGGAIVIFANLLLLCAVVLGEFRVSNEKAGAIIFVLFTFGDYTHFHYYSFVFRWRITETTRKKKTTRHMQSSE